jgi:DNA replication and repair protein RecF
MIISKLHLKGFRNFNKLDLIFSPTTTIIIGPNTIGKTNILESIILLSLGKSFRDVSDRETIKFGEEMGKVTGEIHQLSNREVKNILEIMITNGEVMGIKTPFKKYTVNGVAKRMIDFVGNFRTVLFWPQDMDLVIGSPSLRRKYLDFVLLQVDREYRRTLISYERGIRQRNKVLLGIRDFGAHRHQLLFWDQLVIKAGEYISKKREEYIDFVNNFQFQISNFQLTNYCLEYDSSIISRQRLEQYANEEVASAMTLVGPHRDDIKFKIKNANFKIIEEFRDLAHFGSRGEQRLGIMWLKLCELSYIEKISGDKPVLLLDDIFSELDHEHRDIIFKIIGNQQTILSTTDKHFIPKLTKEVKIIELDDKKE